MVKKQVANFQILADSNLSTSKFSFASIDETRTSENLASNTSEKTVSPEVVFEASTIQSITEYKPVFLTGNSSKIIKTLILKKPGFRQRLKLKAMKSIVEVNKKQNKNTNIAHLISTIFNYMSLCLGVLSIISGLFLSGLGITLGIIGLLFGTLGCLASTVDIEIGIVGLLFCVDGIITSIIN